MQAHHVDNHPSPRSAASCRDPETHVFSDDGVIPNSPLSLLIYRNAVRVTGKANPAGLFEARFKENGWGKGLWQDSLYDFAHYHSRTHEVLGFARGRALIRFGGGHGKEIVLKGGDIVVIPAGVSHQRIRSSKNLLVVGGYPPGGEYDECRLSHEEHDKALETILQLPVPDSDPCQGVPGPLMELWAK